MCESKARPSWAWVGLCSIRQGKPCSVEKTGLAYLLLQVALAVKQRWTSPACQNSLPLRKISSKVATSPQVRTWIYFYVWLAVVQCHIFPLDIMYKLNISLCSSSSLLLAARQSQSQTSNIADSTACSAPEPITDEQYRRLFVSQ